MAAEKAKKEIQTKIKCFFDKCSQKDADGIVDCFTENPTLIVDGLPTYDTREGIRKHSMTDILQYKRFVPDSIFDMFELGNNNAALTSFRMMEEDEQGKILSTFSSDVLWKKVNSEWLIDRYIVVFLTKSAQRQYYESVKQEIQVKFDTMQSAFNNGDADKARLLFTEDGMIVSSMNETVAGHTALREYFEKNIPKWKTLSCKMIFFELLNDDTAYSSNDIISTDELTGKIKARYRDAQTWKKKQGAGWFLKQSIFTEEPVRQLQSVGVP